MPRKVLSLGGGGSAHGSREPRAAVAARAAGVRLVDEVGPIPVLTQRTLEGNQPFPWTNSNEGELPGSTSGIKPKRGRQGKKSAEAVDMVMTRRGRGAESGWSVGQAASACGALLLAAGVVLYAGYIIPAGSRVRSSDASGEAVIVAEVTRLVREEPRRAHDGCAWRRALVGL